MPDEDDSVSILECLDAEGRSPFRGGSARVTIALYRLQQGNFSNVEGVGGGVYECKVNFGPGYRVYFGKDGEQVVILLGGSGKKR